MSAQEQDGGRARLLEILHRELPQLLPAHAVLGDTCEAFLQEPGFSDRARGDYVYVQGRGDRLHLMLCLDASGELPEGFSTSPANWRWLVVEPSGLERARALLPEISGGGILCVQSGERLARIENALPNPGIFIRDYPSLRARWKKISSW